MPARPSTRVHPIPPTVLAALTLIGLATPCGALAADPYHLAILERTVQQEQGGWRIDYRLRHDGEVAIVVPPTEVLARVEGWLSNSRVATHATPRWSSVVLSGPGGASGTGDVITSADEAQRCRERVGVQIWTGEEPPAEPKAGTRTASAADALPILSLAPGATVHVRLRLEHQHFLYGDYDPLLGNRAVEFRLGPAVLRDVLPTDREQYLAQAKYTWPAPPEDRRDTKYFISGPDSLHLEAHIPGNQYYRFPERPVRYATKMRLKFWYLIAPGTEGDCRARIAQYKDTPTAWKVLSEGGHELCLKTVGHWTKVERIFQTESDATTLALDFRICGADIGEMWIDDVSLEPVDRSAASTGP